MSTAPFSSSQMKPTPIRRRKFPRRSVLRESTYWRLRGSKKRGTNECCRTPERRERNGTRSGETPGARTVVLTTTSITYTNRDLRILIQSFQFLENTPLLPKPWKKKGGLFWWFCVKLKFTWWKTMLTPPSSSRSWKNNGVGYFQGIAMMPRKSINILHKLKKIESQSWHYTALHALQV